MAHPQQLAGGEGADIAQIEQNGPAAEPKIEVDSWIAEGFVHEAG
jgi:hypothetical protein